MYNLNSKKLPQLDPKLRETYERVMGYPFPPPQPIAQQISPSTLLNFNPSSNESGAKETGHKKTGISPILLFLLAVVFFAVYTLVWIRILNISLPF